MEREKNQKIQILRALAIMAVVLLHTCPSGNLSVVFVPFSILLWRHFYFFRDILLK